ncbi:uncharacterized protein LOC134466993 [Engraulis encrasicolus]|uniref:uncharacterized protein LOC134466993 n=1 Tax=Engraulis encrasicolus TaxID=184585 RepID=UPI002FD4F7D7
MEVVGFQRGLDYLLERGVNIGVLTTDRSPSIRKLMKDNYSNIQQELDPWHVCKSLKKRLVTASNKKENKILQPWIRSITNHMYWSCSTSKGDKEECQRRWKSLLYHIRGIHRWEEEDAEHRCYHPPPTEEEQRRKMWLETDSPAFQALTGLVMDKNLLRDLRQMTLFKHTGSLEVYHSVILKYAEKRLHFSYDSMRARSQLAILDHNNNLERPQATTQDGQARYKAAYSKQSQQWVAKPIYEGTTQTFRDDLVERVLRRREDSSVVLSKPVPRPRPRRRLLHNIAPVPRPEKSDLVAKARSRYMTML